MTDTSPQIERMIQERFMATSGEQRFLSGSGCA